MTIGFICIGILLILIALGMHVAIALGIAGAIGLIMVGGTGLLIGIFRETPFQSIATYTFAVVPLFIMVGMFGFHSGLGESLFRFASAWFGKVPGGLATASMVGAALFGAVSASSVASAAAFTKLCLPQMLAYGYSKKLAAGTIAISGTLSALIPPSGVLVIYGIMTDQSIGRLQMAGLIPGVMMATIYIIIIMVWAIKWPSSAPKPVDVTWGHRIGTLGGLWGPALVIFAISGGIFTGLFNPTEAGAVGIAIMIGVGLINRKLKRKAVMASMYETAKTTAMVFALMIGAMIFGRFLMLSGFTTTFVNFLVNLAAPRVAIFVLILLMYLVLGCFLEAISMLVITLPFILPIVVKLGYDPIWFGVITVVVYSWAVLSPPVALNVYVVKGAAGDTVSLREIYEGALTLASGTIVGTVLLIAFPALATFLPRIMMR